MFEAEPGAPTTKHELYASLKADEAAKAIALAEAKDTTAIADLLIEERSPKKTIWLNHLTERAALEERLTEQVAREVEAIHKKMTVTVVVVSVFAVLIGILAAFLIAKSILQQLGGEPSAQTYVISSQQTWFGASTTNW